MFDCMQVFRNFKSFRKQKFIGDKSYSFPDMSRHGRTALRCSGKFQWEVMAPAHS